MTERFAPEMVERVQHRLVERDVIAGCQLVEQLGDVRSELAGRLAPPP